MTKIKLPTKKTLMLTHEVGQTDLVFGVGVDSLVGLCMQDYKSLVFSSYDLCHPG